MTEQERLNLMTAYAAGALEGPELEAVRARLAAGDPALTGALADAEVTLARLAGTVPPVAPPPGLKRRILDALPDRTLRDKPPAAGDAPRFAGAPHGVDAPAPLHLTPPAGRDPVPWLSRFAAAAAVGVLLVGGGLLYVGWQGRQAYIARLESELRGRDDQIAELRGPLGSAEARFAVLGPASGDAKQEFGRVLVDPARRQVRVFVYSLVPPPPGKVYQLWLMPEGGGAPVPAPTFTVGGDGKAVVTAAIPPGVKAVAGAAVSAEQPGGAQTPTDVRLVSKAL